jgi:acyl-coenzyme A thioesterase PaaI-like protein
MTWATDRLDALLAGAGEAPPVVQTLRLGLLDMWQPGIVRKVWHACPEILHADGSMFGGYIAALADQMAAFAAMTVVPEGHAYRTTSLQVQFFKLTRSPTLHIEARVLSQSKSIIAVDVDFSLGSSLVARATASQHVFALPATPVPLSPA